MPGIAGAVASGSREQLEVRVREMLDALPVRAGEHSEWRVREGCGLGRINDQETKAFGEANTHVLTFNGALYDANPHGDGDGRPWVDRLMALYREGGARPLGGLNGLYTVAVWDTREKKLTLVTDRGGFRKVFYCHTGNTLLFASEIKALVGQPGFTWATDEQTLVDFMSVGYPLADRTFFRDVKLVPPGSILSFRKGQLEIQPYWDYAFGHDGDARTDDECTDEFAERLKTAVLRRARPGMCVQASGGLDSRSILGTIGRHCPGMEIKTVTVGNANCHDVRFGRRMAEAFRYEHTTIPVPENFYEQYGAEGIRRTEGSTSCVNFFIFAIDDYLKEQGVEAVVNGFLGDSLTGGHLFPEVTQAADDSTAFDGLYRRFYGGVFPDDELRRLLRPHISQSYLDSPYQSIRECFFARDGLGVANRCDYVDLHQRQRRFISGHIDFLGSRVTVVDPYADNDLVDFLLALPPRMRIGQKVYKGMIRRHLPEVARVPRSGTALPLTASWPQEKLIRARMFAYHKLLPRLTLGRLGNQNLSSAVRHDVCLRGASRPFVENLLKHNDRLEDHFDMDEVGRLLDSYMEGRDDALGRLTSLMTIALWHEYFAGSPAVLQPA